MTAIAALVDSNGDIYIGADSSGVCSDTLNLTIRSDEKVFLKGDDFVIGFTTSFRMGQVLKHQFVVPLRPEGISDEEYMVKYFVEGVRACFAATGATAGRFVVGYRGKIYDIENDFQVGCPSDWFYACGCGENLCKGALYAMLKTTELSAESKVLMALEAAEHMSAGVRGPFVVKRLAAKKEG